MRTFYRALVPLLFLTSGCATTRPTAARRDILQVLTTQTAAWNRGDVAGFMQGYWPSDSLVFIGQKGLTYGWQSTLDNYRRSYPNAEAMGLLTFTNLRVEPLQCDGRARGGALAPGPPRRGRCRRIFPISILQA
ncbi:hypothetical protein LRS06_00075 [Hymenobacter sp. J193]|uniref:hypothetical protein n=1 Tax=Hymenobacter sp. J193 TaxID=2898429 RepID=UPI002150CB0A|nr:hypothetical protein [Hymenobacter sp. J193]MCR5886191.1 hypothetical protein [Hymenobacter sp. J193]